jgi:hypothetical protein
MPGLTAARTTGYVRNLLWMFEIVTPVHTVIEDGTAMK